LNLSNNVDTLETFGKDRIKQWQRIGDILRTVPSADFMTAAYHRVLEDISSERSAHQLEARLKDICRKSEELYRAALDSGTPLVAKQALSELFAAKDLISLLRVYKTLADFDSLPTISNPRQNSEEQKADRLNSQVWHD